MFIIITLFVISFIYIEKKDRTEEISTIQYNNAKIIHPVPNKNTQPLNYKYTSDINNKYDNNFDKDFLDEDERLEYECEICSKKISYEEYEMYDGYCEDCFYDVHLDSKGNYHDEELF